MNVVVVRCPFDSTVMVYTEVATEFVHNEKMERYINMDGAGALSLFLEGCVLEGHDIESLVAETKEDAIEMMNHAGVDLTLFPEYKGVRYADR